MTIVVAIVSIALLQSGHKSHGTAEPSPGDSHPVQSTPSTGENNVASPSRLFDLDDMTLTLPISKTGGKGTALMISSQMLTSGFTDSYFRLDAKGQLVFTAPANGATTTPDSGSNHTRSELHENYAGPGASTNGCWTSSLGGTLTATASVLAVAARSDEATIAQIHGNSSAAFVLLLFEPRSDEVVLRVYSSPSDKSYETLPISGHVKLKTELNYRLSFEHGVVSASVNGAFVSAQTPEWADYPVRFTLGAYSAAPNKGNSTSDATVVVFDRFSIEH